MKIQLTASEARVIGCLIEKQITTPDQYPLSLNALTSACNQKSNREPVMSVDEAAVQRIVDGLSRKHLILERSGFGSRVPKFQHRLCNTEAGTLKLDPQELAVVCELMLRGPQTPGELRSRASRMASFGDASEVEATLARLAQHEGGALVVPLAREPGRREVRYAHLLGGPVAGAASESEGAAGSGGAAKSEAGLRSTALPPASAPETAFPALRQEERLTRLEEEVRALREELAELCRRLG
jgi:uncharacterized protein YceH (UPF0502 family)